MKTNGFTKALLLGLVYFSVFVLLVVSQFPAKGPIKLNSNGITMRATLRQDEVTLSSVELSNSGINLTISERFPVRFVTSDNQEQTAVPVSYEQLQNGFLITLDDKSVLKITANENNVTLREFIPGPELSKKDITKAYIRSSLSSGAKILPSEEEELVKLSAGKTVYIYSGMQKLSSLNQELEIKSINGQLLPLVSELESGRKKREEINFLAQAPVKKEVWDSQINDWRNKAWEGLSGSAFNATEGTWKIGSKNSFKENSFIAYEAEALWRGLNQEASNLVNVTRANHSTKITWKSVPYAGRTSALMGAMENQTLSDVNQIEQLIKSGSIDVFFIDDIIQTLFNKAPHSLVQEAIKLASTLDFSKVDSVQAIKVIENYIATRDYLSEDKNPFNVTQELVDKVISPSIKQNNGSFYLQTSENGKCDTIMGLRAGNALIKYADIIGKDIYKGIGQSLITGLLKLALNDGSIPEFVTINGENLEQSVILLLAGDLYKYIASSPFYPRFVSFYKELGPGSWAWTCAPVFDISTSAEQTVYTTEFPVTFSHYVCLYGVKSFRKIQIYNLDYNMDTQFEIYNSSGYYFRRAAGIMYMKIRHKSPQEIIRLLY